MVFLEFHTLNLGLLQFLSFQLVSFQVTKIKKIKNYMHLQTRYHILISSSVCTFSHIHTVATFVLLMSLR